MGRSSGGLGVRQAARGAVWRPSTAIVAAGKATAGGACSTIADCAGPLALAESPLVMQQHAAMIAVLPHAC